MSVEKDKEQPQLTPEAKVKKVREWLNKAGYPLEMRVARAFARESSFTRVELGDIYKSLDREDTNRAIDVAAQLGVVLHRPDAFDGAGVTMLFDMFTVVECKSNPKGNKPWLVFSDPTERMDSPFKVRAHMASELGTWLLEWVAADELLSELPLFVAPRLGYSVTCANIGENNPNPRENNQDTAYEAIMEVLSAARAKAAVKSDEFEIFRIVIPLIVISADLFECWLDPKGELQLEPRDEMALLYKTKPGLDAASYAMIYIVTEPKLPDLIKRLDAAHHALSADEELLKQAVLEVHPRPNMPRPTTSREPPLSESMRELLRRLADAGETADTPDARELLALGYLTGDVTNGSLILHDLTDKGREALGLPKDTPFG